MRYKSDESENFSRWAIEFGETIMRGLTKKSFPHFNLIVAVSVRLCDNGQSSNDAPFKLCTSNRMPLNVKFMLIIFKFEQCKQFV